MYACTYAWYGDGVEMRFKRNTFYHLFSPPTRTSIPFPFLSPFLSPFLFPFLILYSFPFSSTLPLYPSLSLSSPSDEIEGLRNHLGVTDENRTPLGGESLRQFYRSWALIFSVTFTWNTFLFSFFCVFCSYHLYIVRYSFEIFFDREISFLLEFCVLVFTFCIRYKCALFMTNTDNLLVTSYLFFTAFIYSSFKIKVPLYPY